MSRKHAVLAMLAVSLLFAPSLPVLAEDEHHPEAKPNQQTSPSAPALGGQRLQRPESSQGMPGMMMQGQGQPPMDPMGQGSMMIAPMMAMMGMPGMAGRAEALHGSEMMDRVEGRIAFLRAELKIGQPQLAAWDVFSQALRDNAKNLGNAQTDAMKRQASTNVPPTLADRLAAQGDWFAARLKGIGALRQGLERLFAVLSDEQKKTAEDLLAPHLGLGSGGRPMMGMMSMGNMPMAGPPMGPSQ